jgi:branched-chain amino acid transport system permease protein
MIAERHLTLLVWALLGLFVLAANMMGEAYWITLATRATIFAVAGIGLNLALGNGGMVSFGHAAYFGFGGYIVGILATHAQGYIPIYDGLFLIEGTQSMLVTWPLAIIAGGIVLEAFKVLAGREDHCK